MYSAYGKAFLKRDLTELIKQCNECKIEELTERDYSRFINIVSLNEDHNVILYKRIIESGVDLNDIFVKNALESKNKEVLTSLFIRDIKYASGFDYFVFSDEMHEKILSLLHDMEVPDSTIVYALEHDNKRSYVKSLYIKYPKRVKYLMKSDSQYLDLIYNKDTPCSKLQMITYFVKQEEEKIKLLGRRNYFSELLDTYIYVYGEDMITDYKMRAIPLREGYFKDFVNLMELYNKLFAE